MTVKEFIFFDSEYIEVWGDEELSLTPLRNHKDVTRYKLNTNVYFRFKNFDFCPSLKDRYEDLVITIPIGFESDIATIFRPWNFFIAHDDYRIIFPSIIHDYIYTLQLFNCKKFADKLFKSMLRNNNLSMFQYVIMYLAVVLVAKSYNSINKSRVKFDRNISLKTNKSLSSWF